MATDANVDNTMVIAEDRELPASKRFKSETTENIHESLTNFEDVKLVETINEHTNSKSVFLRCRVQKNCSGEDSSEAVIILEKNPFSKNEIENILSVDTSLKQILQNDIYGTYDCRIKPEYNGVKATVIHPATEKHVEKYRQRPIYLIHETAQDFVDITKPHIESETQLSLQEPIEDSFTVATDQMMWVENILEHKKESENIVFEDPDSKDGFILIPDMKWNQDEVEDMYLVAICHRRGLRSLRDLVAKEHLSLLRNLRTKALIAIKDKYGVPPHHLRVFIHYQPSYYHLHVHFVHLKAVGSAARAGVQVERAHLLDSVINNLELVPDFYQKASLTYAVKQGDTLWQKFKEVGKFE